LLADPAVDVLFPSDEWRVLRLDIDPGVKPDVVASITDMAAVADASVDVVWSSHNLEHLFAHEVPQALGEFWRVLKPGGRALIMVPDLQQVALRVAEDRSDEPLYESAAGAIFPLDVIYGHPEALASGNHFMAHRTGFTARRLGTALMQAGFEPVFVRRRVEAYELRVEAYRPLPSPSPSSQPEA